MATHTRRAKEQEHKMWRKAKSINKDNRLLKNWQTLIYPSLYLQFIRFNCWFSISCIMRECRVCILFGHLNIAKTKVLQEWFSTKRCTNSQLKESQWPIIAHEDNTMSQSRTLTVAMRGRTHTTSLWVWFNICLVEQVRIFKPIAERAWPKPKQLRLLPTLNWKLLLHDSDLFSIHNSNKIEFLNFKQLPCENYFGNPVTFHIQCTCKITK